MTKLIWPTLILYLGHLALKLVDNYPKKSHFLKKLAFTEVFNWDSNYVSSHPTTWVQCSQIKYSNFSDLDIELYVILHFILTIFLMVTFCIFLCTTLNKKQKSLLLNFPPPMLCYSSKIENHTLLMWLVLFGKIRGSFLLKVV